MDILRRLWISSGGWLFICFLCKGVGSLRTGGPFLARRSAGGRL